MSIYRTVIHRYQLDDSQSKVLRSLGELEPRRDYHLLYHQTPLSSEDLSQTLECDVNTLPLDFDPSRVKLLLSDLDSTLIGIETIDEIAAELGLKAQVASITQRAMEGELDFSAALEERVALLEGLPASALETVFERKMKPAIQPGAAATLAWARQRKITTALVSGGFTFFTARLEKILPIDHARACTLEVRRGHLTGRLQGPIVDKHAKLDYLRELAGQLNIEANQVVAMGDGANDIPMLEEAGLGVAYHAHAIVRRHADARIDFEHWHALRHLLLDT